MNRLGSVTAGLAAIALIVGACGSSTATMPAPATAAGGATAAPTRATRTGAAPTVAATEDTTSAPATAGTSVAAGVTCHSDKLGLTVTYPANWYAYNGDSGRACTYFDPKPFPTITDASDPMGLIELVSFQDSMRSLVAQPGGKVLSTKTVTVDGKTATVMEIDDTGVGVAPNGMHEYEYLVDLGSVGTLMLVTQGIFDPSLATTDWPYEGYQDNMKVLDFMASALKFD